MKEIIGRTRHGHEVWIDASPNESGSLELQVVSFADSKDNYDVFCVVEAYARRLKRAAHIQRSEMVTFVEEKLTRYLNGPKPRGFNTEALALGHSNSPARLRYGIRLLHPAYRSYR